MTWDQKAWNKLASKTTTSSNIAGAEVTHVVSSRLSSASDQLCDLGDITSFWGKGDVMEGTEG